MHVWNVRHAAGWKCRTQKSRQKSPSGHHRTTLLGYIFATKAHIDNRKKKLVKQQYVPKCPHNMVNIGPLTTEIGPVVWGTPANFNGFRVLALLLHGSQVVSVRQTLRRWTEGATYVRQGDHHVGHWPTFLVVLRTIWLPLSAVSVNSAVLKHGYCCCCHTWSSSCNDTSMVPKAT